MADVSLLGDTTATLIQEFLLTPPPPPLFAGRASSLPTAAGVWGGAGLESGCL